MCESPFFFNCRVHLYSKTPKSTGHCQRKKLGTPWESIGDIYQHIPPIYGLYNGISSAISGNILGTTAIRYPPKGTQNFPYDQWSFLVPLIGGR